MKGYLQAVLYILVIAASTTWVDHLGDNISIPLLLLGVSVVAMLFFNIVRYKNFVQNHKTIKQSPVLWLVMTTSMLLVWWLTYYSVIHASAGILIAIFFLWQGICASIAKQHWLAASLSLLVWIAIYYLSPKLTPITFATSTLAGIFTYAYYRASLAYTARHKMAALDILAIRFYPLILFSSVYAFFYMQQSTALYINSNPLTIVATLIALGFLNMIMPNICSQSSVQNIGAENFSFVVTLTPLLTFLLQGFFLSTWSWKLLLACLLTSAILNITMLSRLKKRIPSLTASRKQTEAAP